MVWRHGDAGTPAALVRAMMSGEAILQIAPGEQRHAPRHDDEIAAADRELECDHANGIDDEGAQRRAFEQAAEPTQSIRSVHRCRQACYLLACVSTLSVTGVPARTASSERSSAGRRSRGPSTFSPRPPQVSTTFS